MTEFDELDRASAERAEERRAAEDEERMHIDNLLASPSGKWLLSQIVEDWDRAERLMPAANSWDMYHHGVRKEAGKYRELIIKHCGHQALDILKG